MRYSIQYNIQISINQGGAFFWNSELFIIQLHRRWEVFEAVNKPYNPLAKLQKWYS